MVETRGTTTLNSWAEGNPPDITLDPRFGRQVYILGGRNSIVQWLNTQGQGPTISNPGAQQRFNTYITVTTWRKHRMLDKDLTLVVILTTRDNQSQEVGGWRKTGSFNFSGQGNDTAISTWPSQISQRLKQQWGV